MRTKASFFGIIFRDASGHADRTDGIQNRVCQLEAVEEGFEGRYPLNYFCVIKQYREKRKKQGINANFVLS